METSTSCLILLPGWWFQPLWKIWVRKLGWWHSQYMESHRIPWFQSPPTSYGTYNYSDVYWFTNPINHIIIYICISCIYHPIMLHICHVIEVRNSYQLNHQLPKVSPRWTNCQKDVAGGTASAQSSGPEGMPDAGTAEEDRSTWWFLDSLRKWLFLKPSGKHTKSYGKSPCLIGKSTN